jgi:hypothetical protein
MSKCFFLVFSLTLSAAQLPDSKLTPGASVKATLSQICTKGYATKTRHVSVAAKRRVFRMYGLKYSPKAFETDHLVPLEVGGANTVNNLWPETYTGTWNALEKDKLENRLHALVCSGQLDLETAQREIRTDWIAAYKKHFHTQRPLRKNKT